LRENRYNYVIIRKLGGGGKTANGERSTVNGERFFPLTVLPLPFADKGCFAADEIILSFLLMLSICPLSIGLLSIYPFYLFYRREAATLSILSLRSSFFIGAERHLSLRSSYFIVAQRPGQR
jgi:hypothetical protein